MTERRKTITERIDEVYEILLQNREPVNLLKLAIRMNMSAKYLREEIMPLASFVHPDIEMRREDSKIYIVLLDEFSNFSSKRG